MGNNETAHVPELAEEVAALAGGYTDGGPGCAYQQEGKEPFSQTYPDLDRPDVALGSCFSAASFTRGVRFVPALAAPQAF